METLQDEGFEKFPHLVVDTFLEMPGWALKCRFGRLSAGFAHLTASFGDLCLGFGANLLRIQKKNKRSKFLGEALEAVLHMQLEPKNVYRVHSFDGRTLYL